MKAGTAGRGGPRLVRRPTILTEGWGLTRTLLCEPHKLPELLQPFSHLFERAWALSSSTRRRAAVRIPTIPCSTRPDGTPVPPPAAAAAMVTDDGPPDGC